jgi:hypothetical protein
VGERTFTAAQVDAAVERLVAEGRFAHAQEIVTHAAPGLQRILNAALHEGGFFEGAHAAESERVASIEDPAERLHGVRVLAAEETRIGMLIGVAVGLELGDELRRAATDTTTDPGETHA